MSKQPALVIRSQAVAVMKDALEAHGYSVTFEQWDGTTKTESFQVRSRGVDTLVIVTDPAYLSEPDPDPLNPKRAPHKRRKSVEPATAPEGPAARVATRGGPPADYSGDSTP